MNYRLAVIQGSLRASSRTAIVIEAVARELQTHADVTVDLIDLREYDMPFVDDRDLEEYGEHVVAMQKRLESAHGYVIGMPVYQKSFSGALKNFLDLHAKAMTEKCFSIVCSSGGIRSYLAPADLVKSLFYEVNAIPVPPTVHAWAKDFEEGKIVNEKVASKITEMVGRLLKFVRATTEQ